MKQHINQQQLSQLTDNGKERLMEWFALLPSDDPYYGRSLAARLSEPLLSIGQMIELLTYLSEEKNEMWITSIDEMGWPEKIEMINVLYNEVLCDYLWSACVEVLNKE